MYYFTTKAKDSYSFHGIAESAKAKYDLFEDRYKGKTFTLSYETRVIEETLKEARDIGSAVTCSAREYTAVCYGFEGWMYGPPKVGDAGR